MGPNKRRTSWWDNEVKVAVKEKKKVWKKYIQTRKYVRYRNRANTA